MRLNKLLLGSVAIGALSLAGVIADTSSAYAAPAPACPHTNFTNGSTTPANCNLVITFNLNGSITTTVPTGATANYDNAEDALIGVVNNSGHTITSFGISGSGIFGFDGDGILDFNGLVKNVLNPDTTGYGGPNGFFTGIVGNSGTVNFVGGIANGGFDFFSLEEPINVNAPPVVTVPEPASLGLLGAALVGFGLMRRRRKGA